MTTRHAIFSSQDLSQVYSVYEKVSNHFLKQFKFQAEFVISSYTSDKGSILFVVTENASHVKWLEDKVSEIYGKWLEKKSLELSKFFSKKVVKTT